MSDFDLESLDICPEKFASVIRAQMGLYLVPSLVQTSSAFAEKCTKQLNFYTNKKYQLPLEIKLLIVLKLVFWLLGVPALPRKNGH